LVRRRRLEVGGETGLSKGESYGAVEGGRTHGSREDSRRM